MRNSAAIRQVDASEKQNGGTEMHDQLQALITNYDHSKAEEARHLYFKARTAATELRVVSGVGEGLRKANELDALADELKEVFERNENKKIASAE